MKADIRWLDDPQVFRVNRLDAHSDHKFYENKEDYKKQNQRLKQSLNGIWKFHYSVNAFGTSGRKHGYAHYGFGESYRKRTEGNDCISSKSR